MMKAKSIETIALDKSAQKEVSKQAKTIRQKLKDGTISIKKLKKKAKRKADKRKGLVYVAHIPHGFYESEMLGYFKQFGKVTNVKVCRSKKTGNSKGYGYVEFQHPEVAKIAADAMNNYLMFKKRIVTEFVPPEKRPKYLFCGRSSNPKNYSAKTRRGKEKHSKNKELDEETLTKKRVTTMKRLNNKIKKLKDLGIQCSVTPVGSKKDISDIEELVKNEAKQAKSKKQSKALLTKSLDSVKALLLDKGSTQDTEIQTSPIKNRKTKKERTMKGGIKKKEKKIALNPETVKKIARELIRKRGNPLINMIPSKPTKTKKTPKRK